MALVTGVRLEIRLRRNIRKHQYNDKEDFYQRAKTYIKLEEAEEPLQEWKYNKEDKKDERKKRSHGLFSNVPRREDKRHRGDVRPSHNPPRFTFYIVLNDTRKNLPETTHRVPFRNTITKE